MLTLNDGRIELWQWDTRRTLSVPDDCSQVHFSNKVFGRSIDVDVVDGVVDIPDILLQTDKELTAWAFVGTPENGYTKISKVFKVNRRNKPADYVFTPPEQTTLGELVERLDKIEESQDPDAIKNAVDDYLQNNPIYVDEKDPTVHEWAKQPEKPKYTATEVGALPSTTNIPSKTSELNNDSGFVNNAVTDLVNYYLKSETYSRDEVKQLISTIPKFSIKLVSQLPTTDISETTIYLVPGGDGDDLYTEYIRVSGKWEILGSQKMDLTGYATETYVKDYAQPKGNYLTEVPKGYATEQFVKEQIAEAELGGEEVDLSGYALKSELPTKTSQLENDSGYLNSVPEGYAKTEDIPTKPEDIGAQPAGDYAIDSEIRLELEAINRRLTAFFDSDDQTLDELSEIVAYITSNKSLIDAITTSKVSVADIVNNLTTNYENRPLSAAQGVVLKGLIDSVSKSLTNYQPKGDYALRSELPTVPTKVSAFENDKGYLTQHQDISGKLDADKLPEAIEDALAQAKESGEFDGKDGESLTVSSVSESSADGGSNVVTFSDGNTLTVKNGKAGSNGANGSSVTVSNVSESTESGGTNVVTFSDGKKVNIKNGINGTNGADGKTPVKGTDYYTTADKTEMVNLVLAALPTWTGGSY